MNNIVNLCIGDWSYDGHNQTETITITTNLDYEAIKKAYQVGEKKLGINFIDTVCADYENDCISYAKLNKLTEAGLNLDFLEMGRLMQVAGPIQLDQNTFAHIYLFIVKQGNPDFKYELVESPQINIGGYGLFHQ